MIALIPDANSSGWSGSGGAHFRRYVISLLHRASPVDSVPMILAGTRDQHIRVFND